MMMDAPFDPTSIPLDLQVFSTASFSSSHFASSLHRLNQAALVLAQDASARDHLGRLSPTLWHCLLNAWNALVRNMDSIAECDLRNSVLSITRFTRNLVAGIPANQLHAFKCEPAIRVTAHRFTSFSVLHDSQSFPISRCLIQTLSNLVTGNEPLLQSLWSLYLSMPEEQNIILRLLSHPDNNSIIAVLVFILNCISDSPQRMQALVDHGVGSSICIRVLDIMAKEEEEENDEFEGTFSLGWSIFKMLIDNGFAPSLFCITTIEEEVVTPHQTTLLKILDSYIANYFASEHASRVHSEEKIDNFIAETLNIIKSIFFKLAEYAETSVSRSLGPSRALPYSVGSSPSTSVSAVAEQGTESSQSLQNLDVLLPKVCEALVLVAQCLGSACLAPVKTGPLAQRSLDCLKCAKSSRDVGLVEHIVELLRLFDAFLPRIAFGKAMWSTPRPDAPPPSSHVFDHEKGFNYLKRDLVRLLGILSYEDRAVQDRVREARGIAIVMNLCTIDERNPYLREHAIFTLRNLLRNNLENQNVVDAMKPSGTLSENGFLHEMHSSAQQEAKPD